MDHGALPSLQLIFVDESTAGVWTTDPYLILTDYEFSQVPYEPQHAIHTQVRGSKVKKNTEDIGNKCYDSSMEV